MLTTELPFPSLVVNTSGKSGYNEADKFCQQVISNRQAVDSAFDSGNMRRLELCLTAAV